MGVTHMKQERITEQVQEVLELLRPNFYLHGGNIEFVEYSKGKVYVRLTGACFGCPASNYTLKLMVESTLRREVPQVKEVVEVSD